MIPVTFGYARVSKTELEDKNLETQHHELTPMRPAHVLIFGACETGITFKSKSAKLGRKPDWLCHSCRTRTC